VRHLRANCRVFCVKDFVHVITTVHSVVYFVYICRRWHVNLIWVGDLWYSYYKKVNVTLNLNIAVFHGFRI